MAMQAHTAQQQPEPGEERTAEEVASGGTDSGQEATAVPEDESGASSGAGEIRRGNSSLDTTPAEEETGTGRIPGGAELGPNPGRSGAGT